MADAFVSVLLQQLASISYQQIEKEVRLVVEVKKEIAKITSNLKAIQAVLEDAEKRQIKEAIVRDWLEKLKDVSYEMDDVLDDWTTEILIQQLHHHQQEGESSTTASVTKKKVCFLVPSSCFCFGQVNRVIHRRDIARRIQDLSDRLNEIARERQSYNFQNTERVFEQLERIETSSFVDLSKIFGREVETEVVLRKLVGESSQEERNLQVIPIVGMGGMGKTTLAQMVYNNEKVKLNFTKRIWVCVSDPFNEIKIAKAIIEDLNTVDAPNSNDLQPLLKCIHRNVEGQKFLLVLDDVWNENYRKWEQLKLSLQSGVFGSRILVTTRKEEVAMIMGATSADIIHLEKLSEQFCWSIFYHIALAERERDESKVFESLGKNMVRRCQGLPLVAKALGGLMRSKKTKKEWIAVLESKIWKLDVVEKQVFQPLLLSYYDLAPQIRRCLLYCVVFPKDHNINKDNVIELWISQGYLSSNENLTKRLVNGQIYFDNLVMRSFFQDFVKDKLGNITSCKMHDIVHDFLQFLTKNDCFILEAVGENRIELPMGNKFRHLTITAAPNDQFPDSFDSLQNLRTLTTFNCEIGSLNPEFILQLKCLRTLNLSNNRVEQLPIEVGGLVHLRYLNLSNNKWKKLPDTLCNLINLETLRVEDCKDLEELPEAMGKLTNLRHLRVKRSRKLKLPRSIAKLTSLQTLDQVNIFSDGFMVSDLRNMDQLQGKLYIRWLTKVNDGTKINVGKEKLMNKKHLVSLKLSFWPATSQSVIQEELLNALQPNPNLESLKIEHHSGTTLCPNWMNRSLNDLRYLRFSSCHVCEFVPLLVLGKLVSLEVLQIRYMSKVKKVGFEYSRIIESSSSSSSFEVTLFPNLKKLVFVYLPEWEKWEGMAAGVSEDSLASIKVMPCLSTLEIEHCHKLKTLPDFLRKTPLKNLSINTSWTLAQSCRNRGGMEWPKICHIPNIQINGAFVQRDGV
ncbi:PREDICTED: putative disease resistance protein RGA3 [Fragaria vesca subsp. vesca]|uniref:putative disease resistance protein RGA3 n=1 Tax=Fragaria vesca subsp. vesca TaxID=101020 RepID=UPI0002C3294D|nr:PREDICTED: putative disease resistance protein RGA3 [Fragaria vesca subsp. vesca]XP_011467074.1 PREDICTED: putative disease resistance protein RGA3 [Fragaria vesca subsp. vesca]XP_011467075.1 PREDICTED: putative disease resistance protein RGA3 [Fragaria vesca subsp. vesca]XP_011467076.1 PREDICTED: putative disease resistance protein RGA3 [Fragaria vesca subsp. vesca]XP_011467077.1 PREDICTED: putative disease resistance protein RGA3 [Fragaria vesca subsp. vesca]